MKNEEKKMKVVILAGGMGTRISEESHLKPKPMIEIGENPILWHIMKIYSHYGFNDFIICCGYKGHMIKEFFADYFLYQSDVTIDLANNSVEVHENISEPWRVTLVNTGNATPTAGRIRMIEKYVDGEAFMMTYGDGVADVDLNALLAFHKKEGKTVTITATRPAGRFGALQLAEGGNAVKSFKEKAAQDQAWVNAGFAVFNPNVFKYLNMQEMLEAGPYEMLAKDGEMASFRHYGFWSPMDTMRDRYYLEEQWKSGNPPWKVWE